MDPKTVVIAAVPESLLAYRRQHCGHARRRSRSPAPVAPRGKSDSRQQGFAFVQAHSQRLHRQFALHKGQNCVALFAAGIPVDDFDSETYAHTLWRGAKALKRSLVSLKLKRCGCNGPHSLSLRSMLKPLVQR